MLLYKLQGLRNYQNRNELGLVGPGRHTHGLSSWIYFFALKVMIPPMISELVLLLKFQ